MKRVRITHLLDDLALGGVTRHLELFRKPCFAKIYQSNVRQINPQWSIAPAMDADMIFVHFPPSWDNLMFLWSLQNRNPGSHIIWMEHSYHRDWEAIQVRNKYRFRSMLRIAASMFDKVICVSAAQEEWLREVIGSRQDFFRVIHPWSNLEGLKQTAFPRFSTSRSITIGAYGRFTKTKGFAELIRAVKLTGEAGKFYLNIGGYGEQEDALRQLAQGCSNIRIYGKVENLPDFLSRCDVVAIPSHFESFGLVAAEAKMAGRPIVVAATGGLPEQVGASGIVTDCTNPNDLAASLQGLRALPLTEMAASARREAIMMEDQRLSSWLAFLQTVSDRPVSRSSQSSIFRMRRLVPIKMSAGQ